MLSQSDPHFHTTKIFYPKKIYQKIDILQTVMSSSTSRIVSTAYYDESGFKEDSTGKKIKFPIESYQGLEKATAERVRRFVDETKANLLRGRLESSPNLSSSRTTSGKLTWFYSYH